MTDFGIVIKDIGIYSIRKEAVQAVIYQNLPVRHLKLLPTSELDDQLELFRTYIYNMK